MINENLLENDFSDSYNEYTECDLINDLKQPNACDVVINKFKDFTTIIQYKKPFFINTGNSNKLIDRRRKFYYDENNELQIARADVSFNDLINHESRSRRRALDNFFGYALSNTWDYFITITFDPKKVDRANRLSVNYAWELLRKKLQYRNPDVKIEVVTEEHSTDGCLHFHGLIGNMNLKKYLTPAINNQKYLNTYNYSTHKKEYKYDCDGNLIPNKYYGQLLKTDFGDQIYNFSKDIFDLGFTTIVQLHDEKVVGDNNKVVMYLQKYMNKDYNSVGYNKKSYYRTHNLIFKDKYVLKSKEISNNYILSSLKLSNELKSKENEKYIIYRIPNDKYSDISQFYESDKTYINDMSDCMYTELKNGSSDLQMINQVFPDYTILDEIF